MHRRAVYTCVTNNYDRVFPPLKRSLGTDYIIFTDAPNIKVDGWRVRALASPTGLSAAATNRWHKVFANTVLEGYRSSIYIDGNIRPIGPLDSIFDQVELGSSDILLLAHPIRRYVSEEIQACIARGKSPSVKLLNAEFDHLLADGFEDAGNLTENNIIVRDHTAPALDPAMRLWWRYISEYSGRDQISLPHVLKKIALCDERLDFSPRKGNPYFLLYPHLGAPMTSYKRLRAIFKARSPEGFLFRVLYRLMVI